jgi:predicted metal-binding membrane protein
MWIAMVLAMMLPTALPMLAVYVDIAAAAHDKRIAIASPFVLACGYIAVWLGFATIAALIQALVIAGNPAPLASPLAGGLLFIGAGFYQFLALKHACLTQCRQPMPYFLSHWTNRPLGIFRMGIEQGVHCLGCCWALMLLGFFAGAMNLVWMAAVGIVMILEKTLPDAHALTYGLGGGLIGAGIIMIFAG